MTISFSSMDTLGNVTDNTRAKAKEVLEALYTVRGKNLSTLWGMGGPPEHSTGRAIDFMVHGDTAAGDFIAQYVIDNRARLGLGWVIWRQRIWTATGGGYGPAEQWNGMEDRGSWTQNHMDHPHVYFGSDAYTPAGTSIPPPATRPAPGPRYPFPLPKGFYFGADDGTNYSVSGKYPRSFNGQDASFWVKAFADQLAERGWSVGKGKAYLTGYGNDGRWGAEYDALCLAFQIDQGLTDRDSKCGVDTWTAAFFNDVT